MAKRIKKFKNPSGPITQSLNGPKINVEGYGDIIFDQDLSDFINRKRATFTGDQSVLDQFDFVNDLYKKGGVTNINSEGIGSGIPNPSLTNKRALKMQKMFGSGGEDYARQQASKQINSWIKEFAEINKEASKPQTQAEPPVLKTSEPVKSGDAATPTTSTAETQQTKVDESVSAVTNPDKTGSNNVPTSTAEEVNTESQNVVTNETDTGAPKSSNPPLMLQRPVDKPKTFITDGFQFKPLTTAEGHNETQLNVGEARKAIEKITDKSISDIHDLSAADIADLSALGLDLVSMASAFTTNPIGSAVSAGTGAASSLITGYTDIFERDEDVLKSLGNTAANLGLDVVGAIPWVGAGAGAAKLMKSVNKVQKILAPALAVMGATNAVNSLEKLNRDGVDKMTINDWKALIDGVQAVASGKKMAEYHLGTQKARTSEMSKLESELKGLDKNAPDFKQKKKALIDKINNLEKTGGAYLTGSKSGIKGKQLVIQNKAHSVELATKKKNYADAVKNFEKAKKSNSPDLKKYETELAKAKEEFKNSLVKANSDITDADIENVKIKTSRPILSPIDKVRTPYKLNKENKFSLKNFQNPIPLKQKEVNSGELREWRDSKTGNFIKGMYSPKEKPAVKNEEVKSPEVKKPVVRESRMSVVDDAIISSVAKSKSLPPNSKNISIEPVKKTVEKPEADFLKEKVALEEKIKAEILAKKRAKEKHLREYVGGSKKSKDESRKDVNESKIKTEEPETKKAEKQTKKQLKQQLKGVSKMRKSDSKDSGKSKERALNRKNYEKLKRQFENMETLYKEPKTMAYDKEGNLRQITGEGIGFVRMRKDGGVLKFQLGGNLKIGNLASQVKNNLPTKLKTLNVGSKRLMLPDASPLSKQTAPVITKTLTPLNVGNNAPVQHIGETVTQPVLNKVLTSAAKVANPRNLKFLNTLVTNANLMDKIKEAPAPTSMVAPTTTKLKAPGMASYMGQFNELAKAENSQTPMYSDPKLETLSRLARGKQIEDSRQQVGTQLQSANQQVEAQNAQLYSQDAANRAQVAAQNAEQSRQHKAQMNQYEQGLIRAKGQSIENLLNERQMIGDRNKAINESIDEQLALNNIEEKMSPEILKLQKDPRFSKRATDPAQALAFKNEMDKFRKASQIKALQMKRRPEFGFLKDGGKISAIKGENSQKINKKLLSLPSKK